MYFDELQPRSSSVPEYWNSAAPVDASLTNESFLPVIELLPAFQSSRSQLSAKLLGAAQKARRNLRQDDWGPTRGEQADALRQTLGRIARLTTAITDLKGPDLTRFCDTLNNNPPVDVRAWSEFLEVLEDAGSTCSRLSPSKAFSDIAAFSSDLISYPDVLDDNTRIAVFNGSSGLHVEGPPQAKSPNLAESVGAWLELFTAIHLRALEYLNAQRGPAKHLTLYLLVCALAEIYCGETGEEITHYLDERGHPSSRAGKFILAAVLVTRPQTVELEVEFIAGLSKSAQKWLIESSLISQVTQALKTYVSEAEQPRRRGRKTR